MFSRIIEWRDHFTHSQILNFDAHIRVVFFFSFTKFMIIFISMSFRHSLMMIFSFVFLQATHRRYIGNTRLEVDDHLQLPVDFRTLWCQNEIHKVVSTGNCRWMSLQQLLRENHKKVLKNVFNYYFVSFFLFIISN